MARHGIRRVTARGRNDGRQLDLPSSVPPDLSDLHGLLPPARGTGGWHHAHERDVALPRDGRVHRSLSDCAGPADVRHAHVRGAKGLGLRAGGPRPCVRALRDPRSANRDSRVHRNGVDRSSGGLCRRRGWNRVIPTATYFTLFLGTVLLMHSFAIQNALFFSAAATVAAILVEGPKHVQIDDDFLMQVFPMLVVYYLLAGFGTGFGPSM